MECRRGLAMRILSGGAENAGVENAAPDAAWVENAGVEKYGKPKVFVI